jgi:diacylglycerol kinase (ATP)
MIAKEARLANPDWPTWLIVNAAARSADEFPFWVQQLGSHLNLARSALVRSQAECDDLLREALLAGIPRLVVGGGDGTLSSVADLLIRQPGPVLGILPLGTGNTFFAGLDLPREPELLTRVLAHGAIQPVDVGLAVHEGQERVFLNSASLGVSSRLVQLLTPSSKKQFGLWAWPRQVGRALRAAQPVVVHLSYPEGREIYVTRQLVIANGPNLAAWLRVRPGARPDDHRLEVFRLGAPTLPAMLRVTWRLLRGELLREHQARYRAVMEVRVDTRPPVPVDLDGDLWLPTPIYCRVLPGALPVLAREEPESRI